jgi:hypothetical protein
MFLFPMLLNQIMDRARSYETGIFKKPADFIQMFKVLSSVIRMSSETSLLLPEHCS